MRALKQKFPGIEVCWITSLKRGAGRPRAIQKLVEKVRRGGLDGLDLQANRALTVDMIKKLRFAGLKVYVWTVDSRTAVRKFADAGVDGITTNRPGWLREELLTRTMHHATHAAHGVS